jgi:hypothetical protein
LVGIQLFNSLLIIYANVDHYLTSIANSLDSVAKRDKCIISFPGLTIQAKESYVSTDSNLTSSDANGENDLKMTLSILPIGKSWSHKFVY